MLRRIFFGLKDTRSTRSGDYCNSTPFTLSIGIELHRGAPMNLFITCMSFEGQFTLISTSMPCFLNGYRIGLNVEDMLVLLKRSNVDRSKRPRTLTFIATCAIKLIPTSEVMANKLLRIGIFQINITNGLCHNMMIPKQKGKPKKPSERSGRMSHKAPTTQSDTDVAICESHHYHEIVEPRESCSAWHLCTNNVLAQKLEFMDFETTIHCLVQNQNQNDETMPKGSANHNGRKTPSID